MNKLFCLLFFITFLIFTFSCKKEDEPVYKFPNVTLTKLGMNDTVIEGGSDTLEFEVRVDGFLDYDVIELHIDFGNSMAIPAYDFIIDNGDVTIAKYIGLANDPPGKLHYIVRLDRGQNSKIVRFRKQENKYYEKGNEIKFSLSDGIFWTNGGGKPKNFTSENILVTYPLVDNDFPPVVGFKEATKIPENWSYDSYVSIFMDAPSALETTVNYEVSGTAGAKDYTIKTSNPAVIPPFTIEFKINVRTIDDKEHESDPLKEYFEIKLNNATNAVIGNLGNSSTLKESTKVEIDDREDQ